MSRQEEIGEFILNRPKGWKASEAADRIPWAYLQTNPKHESLGTQTAEVYKEHLREQGDKHSLEKLRSLETGEAYEPDPGGN